MKKLKIAFLGSRPLGHYALNLLLSYPNIEVACCVVKMPSKSAWWEKDPYFIPNLKVVCHEDLKNFDFDLGVSINYWKIIEADLISKPSLGFINIHHSYNLSLRGRDMTTHAILNARKLNRWYHGTTLHYTDDGLDTGPIIASESCEITESDTAWSLFQKTEKLAKEVLGLWLPRILTAPPPICSPEESNPLHFRNEDNFKKIEDFSDMNKAFDIVRAYDFNGFYEPAFTILRDDKVYLTTDNSKGTEILFPFGPQKAIYRYDWVAK